MNDEGYTSQHGPGIWTVLNRCVLALIVLAVSIPVAYSFLPEVIKRKQQDSRLEQLRSEVEKARMILARHQREETLLKHDPQYIETLARDLFDVMKPGETIYRIEPSVPATSQMRLIH